MPYFLVAVEVLGNSRIHEMNVKPGYSITQHHFPSNSGALDLEKGNLRFDSHGGYSHNTTRA